MGRDSHFSSKKPRVFVRAIQGAAQKMKPGATTDTEAPVSVAGGGN